MRVFNQITAAPFWRPPFRRRPSLVWVPALAVAGAMAIPLVYLGVRAAQADADAWQALTQDSTWRLLRNTALLAFAVTGASVALALPIAWLTTRTDVPLRRVWSVLTVLPLVVPSYVGALTFVAALSRRGPLQSVLGPLGIETPPQIYGFTGAWLVLTLFTYPYLLLVLRAGLRGMDPAMEEASRALGVGPWRTFLRIVVPQLRVPLGAGGLLVALYVASDFGGVSILRFDTFTRAIFAQYNSSFDRAGAAVLGLALVVLVLALLTAESVTRSRGRYHSVGASGARRPRVTHLGRWRWPATLFLALIVIMALGVPLLVLLHWLVRGLEAGGAFDGVWTAVRNSVTVSAIAGLVAVAAALPVALVTVRHRSPLAGLVERLSYIGFALPGIIVALALVFFVLQVVPGLYQTGVAQSAAVLIFAYLVLFLPQAMGAVQASLVRIKPSIEDAARGLGRSPLGVTASITVPLLVPGLLTGFALVFLTTMKELPATILLAPIGFDTLAVEIWSASSEAFFARAAAPALLLILFAALPMALLVGRDEQLRD